MESPFLNDDLEVTTRIIFRPIINYTRRNAHLIFIILSTILILTSTSFISRIIFDDLKRTSSRFIELLLIIPIIIALFALQIMIVALIYEYLFNC